MPRKSKFLEYRRVKWLQADLNLETLARETWAALPTHSARTVTAHDQRSTSGLRSHDFGARGFAIHCGRYTDRQAIGTISMVPSPIAGVSEKSPDEGENFLDGDFMALIKDNHVVGLNCGRNGSALRTYLTGLFRLADCDDDALQFELSRIGRPDTLALINQVGVEKIDFCVSISEATAEDVLDAARPDGMWDQVVGGAGRMISDLVRGDATIAQIRGSTTGTLNVSLKMKGKEVEAASRGFDRLAEKIVEDDESDDFSIHLSNGRVVKANEMVVRKHVMLDAVANSVSVQAAWDALSAYYMELVEVGQIEA